jgi:CRISPR system Cascade subunit CasD
VKNFLLFTIYAPISSWGDIAVGESRGSWDRPSRSAVLGLLGAALGIDRTDQASHDLLNSGYGVAVRGDAAGSTMVDYHTAQTIPASAVKRYKPRTRAQLLECGEPQTILSRRVYRQDALATVAIWSRIESRWTLSELGNALQKPRFVLFAGRKANALGAPLDPEIVEASTLAEAFATRAPRPRGVPEFRSIRGIEAAGREVSHDVISATDGFTSGLEEYRRDIRRDVPLNRTRWQFAERVVEVGLLPTQKPTAAPPERG